MVLIQSNLGLGFELNKSWIIIEMQINQNENH